MKRGYVTNAVLISLAGFTGGVFMWTYNQLTGINKNISDVQFQAQQAIASTNVSVATNTTDISDMKPQLQSINDKVDALLLRNGIDPSTIK